MNSNEDEPISRKDDFGEYKLLNELVNTFDNPKDASEVSKYNPYFHRALFRGDADADATGTDRSDSVQYCLNKDVSLNDALDKMSLAYNPITKQLLFVSPKGGKRASVSECASDEGHYSLSERGESVSGESPGSSLPRNGHQRDKDGGSFSSTVSSLSDYSLSGSPPSRDEPADAAAAPDAFTPLPPDDTAKLKKKTISNFFSRGVFNWKVGDGDGEGKCKPPPDRATSWKLFGGKSGGRDARPPPPRAGALSASEPQLARRAPPRHRRQGSSASENDFQDVVASSTALIQHDRPAGLPAKDAAEADRHAAEIARLVAAARKRAAAAAARGALRAQQRRRQDADRDAALAAWRDAICDWHAEKNSRQVQELWWSGVPPAVRGKVWRLAVANRLNVSTQLYEACLREAKRRLEDARLRRINMKLNFHDVAKSDNALDCIEQQDQIKESFKRLSERDEQPLHRNFSEQNFKSSDEDRAASAYASRSNPDLCDLSRECSMELIELDIARTFPNLCIFQPGGPYFDVLHEVLSAYVCYKPDIGYVQGMSFIAAILILNMDAADAFGCFANLLNGPILRAAFTRDEAAVQQIWNVYSALLVDQLPSLSEMSNELVPELYLLEWLYTAFAKAMPLDAACRVWDVFIRDGDHFLLRTALGILHMYQEDIIKMDFITAAQFLTKLPEDMCVDTLFKSISAINMNIGKKSFDELLASCGQKDEAVKLETDTVVRL